MTSNIICLILGGGVGSRLYPLTHHRAKPAVPIAGKYRLIDIPVSNCLNSGIMRMFVLTQFNSASLNRHIKRAYHFDSFSNGFVDILAAEQTPESKDWFQGTADAVKQSMKRLQGHKYEHILILSGDHLYQMDFMAFAKYHLEKEADLTVATIPCTSNEAPDFGIMKVGSDGFIDRFIEKPDTSVLGEWESHVEPQYASQGKKYLASMGIYLFKKKVIKQLFEQYPDATDFGREIIPKSIEAGFRTASYAFGGYWTDIGTIRSFFEANMELTKPIPKFNLFDNNDHVYTRARMLAPSKIFNTQLKDSLVSDGCIIHAKSIENSVIGIRSRIAEGTVIKNSILMGLEYYQTMEELARVDGTIPMGIGKNCYLENVICDRDIRVGNDVTIVGSDDMEDHETEQYVVSEGLVILKTGATIQDGVQVGNAVEA